MDLDTLVNLLGTAVIGGGLAALFWGRLNTLEAGLLQMRAEVSDIRERMATKDDLAALRRELRGEDQVLRTELRGGLAGVREELAIMRSDLTHVALAVGAHPSRTKPAESS